jgi:hypothetical protein
VNPQTHGTCGEPGALSGARRVREATWRNGPIVRPVPRSGSTSHNSNGGERPSSPCCRSRTVKLRAACSREVPGWVGAALTKPGHASTARWGGIGERDGEEYERNQRQYVS